MQYPPVVGSDRKVDELALLDRNFRDHFARRALDWNSERNNIVLGGRALEMPDDRMEAQCFL